MIVLIGSCALAEQGKCVRAPKDMDIIGSYDDVMAFAEDQGRIIQRYPIADGKKYFIRVPERIIEAEIAWREDSIGADFLKLVKADPDTIHRSTYAVPSLDVLYMLKMSHRYLKDSPHFLKTMRDIRMLREMGAKIRPEHYAFFKIREKATYTYGHPKLNVAKRVFFAGDGVHYVYDHDSIHEAMAEFDRPAYKYYQPSNSEVNVSRSAFFSQPEEIRLAGVLEESYVLALERSQVPFGDKLSPKRSFDIALMKVCTSITSGWFREYAWENYDRVQAMYRDDYVDRFWAAVRNGVVRLA